MVEWSITVVLKTTVPRGTGGSNPSLSANIKRGRHQRCQSLFHCSLFNIHSSTIHSSQSEWAMTHTRCGRNGRQEGRERGYYHLHRNLNHSLLHTSHILHHTSYIIHLKLLLPRHRRWVHRRGCRYLRYCHRYCRRCSNRRRTRLLSCCRWQPPWRQRSVRRPCRSS